MTYREYNDKKNAILSAYLEGRIDPPDMRSKLAELNRDYEGSSPVSTFDNWTERAEEATRKMKERMHEIRTKWAHAYIYGDKVKIKKGQYGLPLVEMSVLEARLLANEILSITDKQRRKRK